MTEGNYIPLTDEAIDDVKEYLKKVVAYAEYRSGNTWTKIPIDHVETLSDGRIAIYVMFYHRGGFLWAGGNESLNKEEFDEGVMYRYTIKIVQSSGNE